MAKIDKSDSIFKYSFTSIPGTPTGDEKCEQSPECIPFPIEEFVYPSIKPKIVPITGSYDFQNEFSLESLYKKVFDTIGMNNANILLYQQNDPIENGFYTVSKKPASPPKMFRIASIDDAHRICIPLDKSFDQNDVQQGLVCVSNPAKVGFDPLVFKKTKCGNVAMLLQKVDGMSKEIAQLKSSIRTIMSNHNFPRNRTI
jgi:hypothetical protein